jgi:hypothetical protein
MKKLLILGAGTAGTIHYPELDSGSQLQNYFRC